MKAVAISIHDVTYEKMLRYHYDCSDHCDRQLYINARRWWWETRSFVRIVGGVGASVHCLAFVNNELWCFAHI